MNRTLIVIDMQNDFINGNLGTPEAVAITPNVFRKVEEYRKDRDRIIFTRDTHFLTYSKTLEGRHLPIGHCIAGTKGWRIIADLCDEDNDIIIQKHSFGYDRWNEFSFYGEDSIELVGLCTDICVVSNALILKALNPEIEIYVDASCCAGTTPENHEAALQVMKSCHINVIGE